MSANEFHPGPPENASLQNANDQWTLVFVREFGHPPDAVWDALTDPAALAQWAPFDADRNLGNSTNATLTMARGEDDPPRDGTDEALPSEIRHADRPRLLEYTWGGDILRWELESIANGTRLTLRHTVEDRAWVPRVAAGWQICLEVAGRMLDGEPVGRVVGSDAKRHGFDALHEAYAERLPVHRA